MTPKTDNTAAATIKPPKIDNGKLTQTLRVASMREKIAPKPPKAVINAQIVVGLKGERPGIPV